MNMNKSYNADIWELKVFYNVLRFWGSQRGNQPPLPVKNDSSLKIKGFDELWLTLINPKCLQWGSKDPLLEPQIWLEQNIDFWCAAMATMT